MDKQVIIRVLFFAGSKDLAGLSETTLQVKSRISFEELK